PLTRADGDTVILTTWRIPGTDPDDRGAVDIGVLATAGGDLGPGEPGGPLTETLREVNEALLVAALQEQAHAEEARSESEAKSVFLASVSHELRTPLNSIIGYSDLLDAGVPTPLPETLETYVNRIRSAAQHLLALIEQIIEASRAEFDERVDAETFDVAALVPEVADLVGGRAREAGIRLEVSAGEPLEVESDRRKVRQILLNLLVNAIKFTPEGRVRVALEHTDETFSLQVSDTGVGIEPDVQDQIFRRFWQAEGTPVRTNGGMGIGLWVVRTLVDALGGSISLDSEPGAGSTFEVSLPRRL
ncbi:MAG: hybrid sensor histidine kinase/response regulator, partial [Gemmatimonadetes bacterium]|nr:HAMP domain-containing histidine kinase [Gemmatimonadota bacterium]NIQ55200.1 HAMP domain-containing histidine kinase [Gemmatimonadota bacterium]NIU75401.1 hybrid sensor histidine kinase/response regulator [Gammaproteobacteria bacterium]NIX45164.1 hybrid sensor histidine kinase/response regulator [Gemmatimonadota bacterium]NIY09407.1 hybrid sensor histidine kinase/response regulator [Gemmatimonadota bacterium]